MTRLPFESDRADAGDLHKHLQRCDYARGRLHRVRCAVEALDAFLAPRVVTSLTVLTVLVLAGFALPS